jgi:hypothetical protein
MVPARVAGAGLLGAGAALDHRVDRLEVRGVRGEREVHVRAGARAPVAREALVILDVARAERRLGQLDVLELREDRLERLADDVREDVQPAAVRHADHQLAHAVRRRILDDRIEQRDQRFGALEPEALLPDEARVEEALEQLGRRQLLEDAQPLLVGGNRGVLRLLHAPHQPLARAGVLDVRELDADLAAVRRAQAPEDLHERLDRAAGQVAREERMLEVRVAEAVVRGIELGEVLVARAERVGVGDAMPARAVGVDEPQHARVLLGDLRARERAGRHLRRLRLERGERPLLALEHVRPALVHGVRIELPALTDLRHDAGVHPESGRNLLGVRPARARVVVGHRVSGSNPQRKRRI